MKRTEPGSLHQWQAMVARHAPSAGRATEPAVDTPPSNTGVNKLEGDAEAYALAWPVQATGVIPFRKKVRATVEENLVLEGGKVKAICADRQQLQPTGVIVDYLRVTVKKDDVLRSENILSSDDETICQALAFRLASALGFELGEARKGRDYYDYTWTVHNAFGRECASVSGGGVTQRETFCLTLKGEACTYAAPGWERRLFDWLQPLEPRVTRIDLARDFLAGELTVAEVVHCYKTGEFDYRNRRPSYGQHGCWMGAEADQHSRTFQVGQRDSGKLMRAYEKGHQYKLMADAWLRVEVELRNVNRIIPFEALVRPGDFFAGAYEFCQMILDTKPVPERVATGKKVGEASVQRMMNWVERVVAPTLVHICAATPDFSWLEEIVSHHIARRAPRSIAGINHRALTEGLRTYLDKFSERAPASFALPLTAG